MSDDKKLHAIVAHRSCAAEGQHYDESGCYLVPAEISEDAANALIALKAASPTTKKAVTDYKKSVAEKAAAQAQADEENAQVQAAADAAAEAERKRLAEQK